MCSSSYDSKKSDSTEDSNNVESRSYSSFQEGKFTFPPAPRLCKSASNSPCSLSCKSDSSVSDGKLVRTRRRGRRKCVRTLPPIGVFWDIENCQVPRTKSATSVVQRIRELFYVDYREAEFLVVCDVKKESTQIVQDLNDAQVNLIHVSSTCKNAADEKLRQSVRRFAELHKAPAAVALISSDVNFAADLSDLRYRKKIHVILVHNSNVADALILCASETYNFTSITETIPPSVLKSKAVGTQAADLCIYNLPINVENVKLLKSRLKLLSDNCGGRVLSVNKDTGTAVIRFCSLDFAKRAQKRLEGEDVFGSKIRAANPGLARESPFKNYTGRKIRNSDQLYQVPPVPMSQMYGQSGFGNGFYSGNNSSVGNPWKAELDQGLLNAQQPTLMQSLFRPIRGSGFMDITYHRQPLNVLDSAVAPLTRTANRNFGDSAADSKLKNGCGSTSSSPIELIVSNLDSSVNNKELQSILLNMLKQYAMVLNLTITTQADGSPVATVKVGSQQEAQYVISQLHHQWLGCKRMSISYAQTSSDPDQLRFMIVALLQEVPGNRMPLFKFFELAESRYHCSISLSEVNKLKDVCKITEGHGGRTIALTPEASITSPMYMYNSFALYCTVHCPNGLENRGWGEAEEVVLPNIKMSLKLFAIKVNQLLVSHMGCIPLLSFPVCYSIEFGHPLPVDPIGVPLDHLVTCISNVELSCSGQNKNVKYLKMKDVKDKAKEPEDPLVKSVSPSLMTNINMLCREVVEILKTTDRCQLLMSRYIPAYHHHFGRQCRVADYGFTRLVDLFEAISHVVQVIGSGAKRTITLTHSAQMRRFTSDLLRVIKSQSGQVTIGDFPAAYEKALNNKPFNPVEYGLCSLDDLLEEVPENTVVINRTDNIVTISIPKKEQTGEQVQRTKQFALDVVELLSHSANCSMLFNKFVPAYHHHFGRQCKVSDYGFAKLAELFEAIPKTVELEGASDVDRKVKLKPPLALKVLGAQIQALIKESRPSLLHVELLPSVYKRSYGFTLKPQAYGCKDFEELILNVGDFIQVVHGSAGPLLVLTDVANCTLEVRIWSLLLYPPHSSSIKTFIHAYRVRFLSTMPMTKLEQLKNVIVLSNNGNETIVSLTNAYVLAAQLYHLLFANGGHIPFNSIENVYSRKFNRSLYPGDYGANSLEDLLKQMTFLLILRGKKMNVVLNKQLADYGINLPPSIANDGSGKIQENMPWPPPAAHNLINNVRGITPPKPDTPPVENGWNSRFWNSSPKGDSNLNLSIPLPSVDTSKVFMDTEGLLSPTRSLLSAHTHPLNAVIPKITAPHPTDLPLPDKLILKDDSSDSGVHGSKVEFTLSDNEYLSEPLHCMGAVSRPGSYNKTFSTFSM